MRDLQECKAEIFRRSEEKIRLRKKRRAAAIGIGVPLCLCTVITTAALMNGALPATKDVSMCPQAAPDQFFEMVEDADNASREPSMSVYVITKPEAADALLQLLEDPPPESPMEPPIMEEPQHSESVSNAPVMDQAMPWEYRLLIFLSDGQTIRYRVRGREVFCETAAQTRILTHQEAQQLAALVQEAADEGSIINVGVRR